MLSWQGFELFLEKAQQPLDLQKLPQLVAAMGNYMSSDGFLPTHSPLLSCCVGAELTSQQPVVFAYAGCRAPSAPCSVAMIPLQGADDHVFRCPKSGREFCWCHCDR